MRFAALGRTQWLYDAVREAVRRGHQAALIGTCPASPEYTVREEDFARLAETLGCPFFCDARINRPECIELARSAGADVAISVNWLTLIGHEMAGVFPHGIINAHAGDVPRYRGNAAPNWAILAGESRVVLTLHRVVSLLDGGPVLLQRELPLTDRTYIGDVYRFMADNIPDMFVEVLEGIAAERVQPREQPLDPALSLRCYPRLPRDGEIDWSRPAMELARLVRASAEPFAGAYTHLGLERVTVWRAHAAELPGPCLGVPGQVVSRSADTGEVAVLTGDGILVLTDAETSRTGRVRPADVVRSMRDRLGLDAAGEIERLEARVAALEARLAPP